MRVGENVFVTIKNKFHIPIFIKQNRLKITLGIVSVFTIILLILCIIPENNIVKTMGRNFLEGLGIYTEEIKSVHIESDDFDDAGEWRIEKSAKWIGSDTAELTIKLNSVIKTGNNYKDIIIVLDVSESMDGDKIDKAISDAKELTDYVLSDSHNRVALITFESGSTILSPFTDNKNDIIAQLNAIEVLGCTNYNAALLNVNSIMNGYTKQNNRDVVTLFLTDGYPNEDTPNQIGTYEVLKDSYPYMTINGIQYEMGLDIIDEIKQISDNQWVANQETLNNILFEAAVTPITYENLIINDFIHNDYFTIESVNDINVTNGTVTLTEESGVPKIMWDFGNYKFLTGGKATLKAKLKLKQQYIDSDGYYPTSKNAVVNYKVSDDIFKTKSSTKTPVLKNSFEVIYDTNTPEGCSLSNIPSETHFVFQNVTKKTNELSCNGYLFKGWVIDEEDDLDITHVNDDVFVMPGHDVTIRGTWTRQTVTKTMDGTVHEKTTLYKVLKNEAEVGTYAKEFEGDHQDSMDSSKSTQKIYHYYSGYNENDRTSIINDKNNVIFANHCWQMYRTTDTGGVKLVYNGEVVDNKCLQNRGTHIGYNGRTSTSLNSNYWYGSDYTFDSSTGEFSLSGDKVQETWNDSTGSSLIGKYTCKSTSDIATCTTLYLIESYKSSTQANALTLNSNSNYSMFGKLQYNENKERSSKNSIAYAGYMYGDEYYFDSVDIATYNSYYEMNKVFVETSNFSNVWFADDYSYDQDTGKYTLINPYLGSSKTREQLVGKYTHLSSNVATQGNDISYIVGTQYSSYLLYMNITNNKLPSDYKIKFSDSVIDNGDGTYSLENPITMNKIDWLNDRSYYEKKYTCGNEDVTCSDMLYTTPSSSSNYMYAIKLTDTFVLAKERDGLDLIDTLEIKYFDYYKNPENYKDYIYTCHSEYSGNLNSSTCTESNLKMIIKQNEFNYVYAKNYYYGSSVSWDGEKYTLNDIVTLENYQDLGNHHFICKNPGEKQCTSVMFIYNINQATSSWGAYGVMLENGVLTTDEMLNNMLHKNSNESIIKTGVEAWYKHYLYNDYDNFIEDTIFCNEREIASTKFNANDNVPYGFNSASLVYASNYGTSGSYCPSQYSCRLTCNRKTDKFSIYNVDAPLKYKVGLITYGELEVLNNDKFLYLNRNNRFWTITPAGNNSINITGYMCGTSSSNVEGVRPVISLRPGIEYSDGDGSMEHPYIIDTNS